jgi:hypothetical protein
MKKKVLIALSIFGLLLPLAAAGQTTAIVVITDDGGIGEASARTARQLASDELRANGVAVATSPELDRLLPLSEEVKKIAQAAGAQKIYALTLSALGGKIIVRVEEFTADLQPIQNRRLSSRGPEELDIVIPRVVKALITGKSAEDSAEIDTVTQQEGRKWEKKPGEFMWGGGVMLGGGLAEGALIAYGFDLRSVYEMKHFRLNAVTGGILNVKDKGNGFIYGMVGASYIPSSSDWSPYFGGGFAYLASGVDGKVGNGVGANVHVGFEAFRLHRARMLIEFGALLPFYQVEDNGEESYVVELYGLVSVMM